MISGSSTATSATVEYGRLGVSSLPEIWLPTREYIEVMSEIRTHLSDELKHVPVVSKPIGNYVYTFENDWENGDFSIIGKSPIDKEWRRRR